MVLVVMNLPARVGDIKTRGFDSWVGKIPWRSAWQPTPVFLPRESLGQRSLVGYSPQGCKELDMTEQLSRQSRTQQGMRGKRWTGPNSEGLDPAVSGAIRGFLATHQNAQICSQQKQGGCDDSNSDTGQCLCQDAKGKKKMMIQCYTCNTVTTLKGNIKLCLEKKIRRKCVKMLTMVTFRQQEYVCFPAFDFTELIHVTKEM